MMNSKILWPAILIVILSASTASARTWTVEQNGGGDFQTIADAVTHAVAEDSILVGVGVYAERGIVLDKVLHLVSTAGAGFTTIDGESAGQILDYVDGGGGSLSGFSLVNADSDSGAGAVDVNIYGRHLTISHCEFRDNQAVYQGGGIAAGNSSYITVTDCLFANNHAPEHCGAAVGIQGSHLDFEGCRFIGNTTDVFAAALAVHTSILNVRDCLFVNNKSGDVAGGLYYFNSSGTVEGNTFVYNTSPGRATVVINDSFGTIVRRNIFAHDSHGFGLQYIDCSGQHACNIYWQNPAGDISPSGLAENEQVADPMFCATGQSTYGVYDVSPAAPENSLCRELVGALPVSCTTVATEAMDWGEVKTLY